MSSLSRLTIRALAIAAVVMSAAPAAHAQQACVAPVAVVESVKNTVQLVQASTKVPRPAVRRVNVCTGDLIRVGENSRAVILILSTNTPLALDQNSELVITAAPPAGGQSLIELLRGALLFISRTRQLLEIRTPFVNAAIEGTEFVLRVLSDRSVITVFEGAVRATNPLGSVVVGAGQQAVAVQGQPPVLEIPVRPRDAVQWALYYQPIRSIESLEQLNQIPSTNRNAEFYIRRANALLAAGQVESARADIAAALEADPNAGEAHALRAVIAVALNERDEALASARIAVARTPTLAAAHVALSYALQSHFDLEGARTALIHATELKQEDGLAWARLAEIELSLGSSRRALFAARRGTASSWASARSSTVLGYAALAEGNLAEAERAFAAAITAEPGGPLARLGYALTEIRRGRLEEGRRYIEIAVALDPSNALLRSYLGKAFFEEKRDALAADQLAIAKTLDPLDPTPWFYDAIRKHLSNKPVDALRDIKRAIELNGNRAVYRSRLLLDHDLAARSAALAQIYREVGFDQLALSEGWKSLISDPTEYGAHRFMADMYSVLPRHEIARVSELLQAQLRQPLNLTPVQPQLAEADAFLIEQFGPSRMAFNEFNPLFLRNRFSAQTNFAGGTSGMLANDFTASAVYDHFSASIGQFQSQTNGTRVNNDFNHRIYNALVQLQIAGDTGLQAEFRTRQMARGDLSRAFDTSAFQSTLREQDDVSSVRIGVSQKLTRRSELLVNAIVQNVDQTSALQPILTRVLDRDGSLAEAQYSFRDPRMSLTAGAGIANIDRIEIRHVQVRPTMPPVTTQSISPIGHDNAYLYSHLNLSSSVAATLGVSVDLFDGLFTRNQINPKLGVLWTPATATTVRAAIFRSLKRRLITAQTLEPTHVSGFGQFFDDDDGTDAWRYGVGAETALDEHVNVGGEWSGRELDTTIRVTDNTTGVSSLSQFGGRERDVRAYLYWTPLTNAAFSADYNVLRMQSDRALAGLRPFTRLSTHTFGISGRVFLPFGASAGINLSRLYQRGTFVTARVPPEPFTGRDSFVIIDLFGKYRLPRRLGIAGFEAKNIFDAGFQFQELDPTNPRVAIGRQFIARISFFL